MQLSRFPNIGIRINWVLGPTPTVEVEEFSDEPIPPVSIGIPGIYVQRVITMPDHRDQS